MTTTIMPDRFLMRFAKWDRDGSGTLELSDFEQEAARTLHAFGADPASAEARNLIAAYVGQFEALASMAGVPVTASITEAEFLRIAEELMAEEGETGFHRLLRPMVEGVVGLCDRNTDGLIDHREYVLWGKAVGVDQWDAVATFQQIDTDHDGRLTVDELLAALCDYVFGRLDAPMLG